MVHWCIGALVHWCIGASVHRCIGTVGDHLLSAQPDLAELGEGEDWLECLSDERLAPHLKLGIGHLALGMGRWALGVGHWALGMGHWA